MPHSWNYPIADRPPTTMEWFATRVRRTPGFCPVCRSLTVFTRWRGNFRESGVCLKCGSFNRQRQIASVAHSVFADNTAFDSLAKNRLAVFNTETRGSLHNQLLLSSDTDYTASEYFGPDFDSGQPVDGIRHEDVQSLSFSSDSLDLVISSDVWEHVPRPYVAHAEVFRVLRPGGYHVFTAAFHQTQLLDDVRAVLNEDGSVNLVKNPIYHSDPISADGALVYVIFSVQMLSKMAEVGYRVTMHKLYSPRLGILGNNALVFSARKPIGRH